MYSEVDFTKIGIAIKMLRARKHISQRYLAELIGISQTHMSNIESGRVQVNLRLMAKMADVFDCRLDDFFRPPEHLRGQGGDLPYSEEDLVLIIKLLQLLGKKK